MRIILVRHKTAPWPTGCRWCGIMRVYHGTQYAPSTRHHTWEKPTGDQFYARVAAHTERLRRELGDDA